MNDDRLNEYGAKLATLAKVATIVLLLALFSGNAFAQRATACSPTTPNNALCVTWEAPATNTDGTPIVQAITYRVERKFNTGTYANVASGISVRQLYQQNLAPGLYVFRVFATVQSQESLPSAEASKAATANPPPVPNPPTIITIAVVISPDAPPHIVTVNGTEVYASNGAP